MYYKRIFFMFLFSQFSGSRARYYLFGKIHIIVTPRPDPTPPIRPYYTIRNKTSTHTYIRAREVGFFFDIASKFAFFNTLKYS